MFLERGRISGCLDSHTLNRLHQSKHLDRSFRPRTWLDESGVNIQGLTSRIPLYKGLRAFPPGDNEAQFSPFFVLYFVYFKHRFLARLFSTKFLPFADEHHATPVQDTAQRRHRRRRAVGTRCKDSFQTKTLRKPFLLSLVAIIPWFLIITRGEAGVLASSAPEEPARTWTQGA